MCLGLSVPCILFWELRFGDVDLGHCLLSIQILPLLVQSPFRHKWTVSGFRQIPVAYRCVLLFLPSSRQATWTRLTQGNCSSCLDIYVAFCFLIPEFLPSQALMFRVQELFVTGNFKKHIENISFPHVLEDVACSWISCEVYNWVVLTLRAHRSWSVRIAIESIFWNF